MLNRLCLAAVLLSLWGCATSGPSRSSASIAATTAKLTALRPANPESGVVVLYRNKRFGSMLGPITYKGSLFVNEVPVGDIEDDTYGILELSPGRHSLRISGSGGGIALQASMVAQVKAGEVQFVEVGTDQGMSSASVSLKRIPGPNYEEIANDCREAFQIDLAGEAARKPAAPSAT